MAVVWAQTALELMFEEGNVKDTLVLLDLIIEIVEEFVLQEIGRSIVWF